jgi:hypothetical protein
VVLDHYVTVEFSDDFKGAVRAKMNEALAYELRSSQGVPDRFTARLDALDTKMLDDATVTSYALAEPFGVGRGGAGLLAADLLL